MQQHISKRSREIMALVVLGALAAGPALAQGRGPGEQGREHSEQGRGNDQHNNGGQRADQHHRGDDDRNQDNRRAQARFDDHQRRIVSEYYETEMRRGHCPPGLARKHNGCQPPGHAKRYVIGRPLPRDVIFYEVPHRIAVHLGAPPRGYRYARVSNDILLLALGTGLVVDALQDLGRIR